MIQRRRTKHPAPLSERLQVVSLPTSSLELEPEYSEMYADDSVNEDYLGSLPKTKKAASSW